MGGPRPTIRRVHVVGGAGSGKTTLARRLVDRLGAPHHDLDAVGYEGGAGPKRSLEARLADVRRIAAEPSWVTEGIYLRWTEELLRAADLIVWLDVPWRVAAWRIVLRHVRADLTGTNRHRGYRKLARFVCGTRRYYLAAAPPEPTAPDDDFALSRAATAVALAPYAAKVVRCQSARDVARVEAELR
jgi:molybdopterin-guanine dinucleotide biosynthesis protein